MSKKPKLIISTTSPYARKARITALEKNIDVEIVIDVPWNEDTGVIALNPLGKVHRGLKHLDEMLGDRQYFYANKMSVADIAVASALGYVGLRFSEDFKWPELYPHLAKFYSQLLERPSFKETVPVL